MKKITVQLLTAFLFISFSSSAQANKEDVKTLKNIKETISFLADDKLEGRRTGTAGEKLAYGYIQDAFHRAGLLAGGLNNSYIQEFDVNDGKVIDKNSYLRIGSKEYALNTDYFPMPYSGRDIKFKGSSFETATLSIEAVIDSNKNNPHFDLHDDLVRRAKDFESAGYGMVFFVNAPSSQEMKFEARDKTTSVSIPVVYLVNKADAAVLNASKDIKCKIEISESHRTGHNVIGYIDNKATNTIILGAHYDHLGYGEDHNSLYAGSEKMIHNGADDNASGTAALIELGRKLNRSPDTKYNYLFIAFSGEELGLFGSKYFTDHANVDLKKVDYMINMDMVGRLNDSTHGLTIGGYGTSPSWGQLIKKDDPYFKINPDSSGSGPSDHTSFYRKDIPVLFFFTGSHKDYHKPSDDADKINYDGEVKIINYIMNLIAETNQLDKLAFAKTREAAAGKNTFKVSLGIMPDYTFSGNGVRVDGVSDNRPAQKAGIKTDDVLMQLGDHKFSDVQTYMDALNKFNKGESTTVRLMRGKEELVLPITF